MTELAAVRAPSPAGRAIVEQAYARPDWAAGAISSMDAWFLAECLEAARPRAMIEIGVASGVSTAYLLRAIELLGLDTRLYSFDVIPTYYADPTRKLGAFLDETFERIPERLSLFPGVRAMNAPARLRAAGAAPAELVFIDADHAHPWPCFDLLTLLPVITRPAWIVLHDIGLPLLRPGVGATGPAKLFEHWPGPKQIFDGSAGIPNIGAIQTLESVDRTIDAVLDIVELPWDGPIDPAYVQPLIAALRGHAGRDARLRAACRRNAPSGSFAGQLAARAVRSIQRRLATATARLRPGVAVTAKPKSAG